MNPFVTRAGRVAAVLLATWLCAGPAHADDRPYADQKVVYHNDGGMPDNGKYFSKILRNLRNHLKALGPEHVGIKVVDHSDGVILLQMAAANPELAAQIDDLRRDGVQFLVCKNTLAERKIDWHTLYGVQEGDLVTSGVAELIDLQARGYLYVHP